MTTVIDFPELPDHDQISERVRIELGQRLTRLLDRFEMFLEDDPRDFSPGQIANYLTAVKLFGGLYQTFQRPVDRSGMLSVDKVEKLLQAARTEAALEAVEAERSRIAHERRMALESAGSDVRSALQRERDRQDRQKS